jgi:cell division protein FtsB
LYQARITQNHAWEAVAMQEVAELKARIEQLEAALREIAKDDDGPITMAKIARAALAPEQEK